jgi:hypothetical protein
MSEEKDIVTEDEQDDSTQGSNEVSIETVTVQKRKALEQRNEEREKNKELQKQIEDLKKLVPSATPKSETVTDTSKFLTHDDVEPLKFALAHKDLGEKELEKLSTLKKAYGSLDEAFKSEEFQAYLEKATETRRSGEEIPSGNRSGHQEDEEIPNPVKDRDAHRKWVMDNFK